MSDPFIGELRIFAFGHAPKGWALCRGQLLPINQNQALFSLLGTMYGGDGRVTFALPNLQGRGPMHIDDVNGFPQGAAGGEVTHTLTTSEMPSHTHVLSARPTTAPGSRTAGPAGALWTESTKAAYDATPTVAMAPGALGNAGNGQPHPNMPPYLVLSFAIALVGIFPSPT
jgi:microcystin-dependent protein